MPSTEAHEIDRLLAFLAGRQGFALGLATYDDRHSRDEIIGRIVSCGVAVPAAVGRRDACTTRDGLTAPKQAIFVSTLQLARGESSLLDRLTDHLRDVPTPPDHSRAVMVMNIEEALDYLHMQPDIPPALFGNANMMREAFTQQCPVPIVLWLMPAATALLTQSAPDFWHWRSATFDFSSGDSERRIREATMVGKLDAEWLALPRHQRDENTTLLHDLLKQAEQADDAESIRGQRRRWELLNQLGTAYRNRGEFPAARHWLEQALELANKIADGRVDDQSEQSLIPVSLNHLGLVLRDLGDLPGAKQAIERALQIDEKAFGPDHPEVAIDVNNLGGVLRALGDLPGAKQAYERALGILRKFLGDEHPNTKTVRGNLEVVNKLLGGPM